MKTLLLMRHAKSSWKHAELEDQQRPLNKRGEKDAPMMGKLLKEKELIPQRILSSIAVRARQTVSLLAEKAGFHGQIDYLDIFYMAEPQVYLEALTYLPDDVERVMIVGHNPGLEGLLQILSKRVEALPTAGLAYLSLPIKSWSELNAETKGELVEFWRPKELR